MEAFCVKCKTKREIHNAQALFNARGAAYTKGVCPVCGAGMIRLGVTDAHATLDRDALIAQAKQMTDNRKQTTDAKPAREKT